MRLIHDLDAFRAARAALPTPVGFVPTMGALHAGHLSLVRRARADCASVVLSIFVNPTQFDRPDDLARYPRDLEGDLALLAAEGVDVVLAPDAEALYPAGHSTRVHVGAISERLEGAHRPGHFDGVATIVAKLFNLVQPQRAYFGQKDAQQLAVIQRMVSDLDFPVEIVPCPIIREPDGLALSSRNVFLDAEARQQALALSRALGAARAAWQQGERGAEALRAIAHQQLDGAPGLRLDYLSLADPTTLDELDGPVARGLMSLAAWVGGVRLIDNLLLDDHPDTPQKG